VVVDSGNLSSPKGRNGTDLAGGASPPTGGPRAKGAVVEVTLPPDGAGPPGAPVGVLGAGAGPAGAGTASGAAATGAEGREVVPRSGPCRKAWTEYVIVACPDGRFVSVQVSGSAPTENPVAGAVPTCLLIE
jgi:hypothetical protein